MLGASVCGMLPCGESLMVSNSDDGGKDFLRNVGMGMQECML
jgi:hypothetical protein